MKKLFFAALTAVALLPLCSFAQTVAPVTLPTTSVELPGQYIDQSTANLLGPFFGDTGNSTEIAITRNISVTVTGTTTLFAIDNLMPEFIPTEVIVEPKVMTAVTSGSNALFTVSGTQNALVSGTIYTSNGVGTANRIVMTASNGYVYYAGDKLSFAITTPSATTGGTGTFTADVTLLGIRK